jgi:hypothetical protein
MLGIVFILGKYVVLNNLLPKIVFADIKKTWVKSFPTLKPHLHVIPAMYVIDHQALQ